MTRALCVLFVALFLSGCEKKAPQKQVRDFKDKIVHFLPAAASTFEGNPHLQKLLSQRFVYLGAGAECFCFLSEDKSCVLKFFREGYFFPKLWIDTFPFSLFKSNLLFWYARPYAARLARALRGYQLAYEEMQEETGVFFAQLKSEISPSASVTLVDKHGRESVIDLEGVPFVLQRYAIPADLYLRTCIEQGKKEEAARAVSALTHFLCTRLKEGIVDTDHGRKRLGTNYGFTAEGRPIQIDLGHLVRASSPLSPKEEEKLRARVHKWLQRAHPALASEEK